MSPPDVGRGRKMPLARLGPVGGNVLVQLHFDGNETSLQEYNCFEFRNQREEKSIVSFEVQHGSQDFKRLNLNLMKSCS